ncbi:MAG: nuclear transport factor 2 family protein [Limisphaerales bacterium]
MQEHDLIRTVRGIYEAFGRGDVPAILEHLSPDVEWEYGGTGTDVPWLQRRVGRDAAAGFFEALRELRMDRFSPREFLAGDRLVVVLLEVDFTVTRTGRRVVEEDEIHVWRFDTEGRVSRFRHGVDSHRHQAAWGGPPGDN